MHAGAGRSVAHSKSCRVKLCRTVSKFVFVKQCRIPTLRVFCLFFYIPGVYAPEHRMQNAKLAQAITVLLHPPYVETNSTR